MAQVRLYLLYLAFCERIKVEILYLILLRGTVFYKNLSGLNASQQIYIFKRNTTGCHGNNMPFCQVLYNKTTALTAAYKKKRIDYIVLYS